MRDSSTDPVLAAIARAWPELGDERPPARDALALRLASRSRWRVAAPVPGERYEDAVADGRIPTRERDWHDAFNVHAFAVFPRAKAALHARMRELPCIAGRRTREGDALALLDETALVLTGSSAALAELDVARRGGVLAAIDLVVRAHGIAATCFGHALLEHRRLGRPPINAGVVVLEAEPGAVDAALADAIGRRAFVAPAFAPNLPWPDDTVDAWLLATMAHADELAIAAGPDALVGTASAEARGVASSV